MKKNFITNYMAKTSMGLLVAFMVGYPCETYAGAEDTGVTKETFRKEVKGVVSGPDGMGIPGALVKIKGTGVGTSANVEGEFSINVEKGQVLVVSSLGYITKEIEVGNESVLSIVLEVDTKTLEEVVVIGYGTKSKETLAGAVEVVGSELIESRPAPNVLSALQGAIPGVTITRGGGQPGGEGFNINIRGISSVNGGNSPLILIDGNPSSDLNLINPHDIETVTVLKDASAAIYGSRAAGGVILVTTKSGGKGKPTLRFTSNVAFSQPLNKVLYPNLYQYAQMSREADIANGTAPFWDDVRMQKILDGAAPERFPNANEFQFYQTTDWFDQLFSRGIQQDYNLSLNGGGDRSTYYFSLGYNQNNGMVANAPDKAERLNLRMNYSFDILDNLKLSTRVGFDRMAVNEVYNLGRAIGAVSQQPIFFPVKTPEGRWFSQWGYANPVTIAQESEPLEKWTTRILPNFKLDWEIIKGLVATGQASMTFENYDSRLIRKSIPYYFWDEKFAYYEYQTSPNNANYSFSKTNQRNYSVRLQYDKTLGEDHNISIMGGGVHEEYDYDYFSAYRDNFVSDELFALNLGGTDNMQNSGGGNHWALQSLISRLGYTYKDKYIFEANMRYDGSSRFAEEQRWKLFKGGMVAWRLSEEDFIKDFSFINNLKLRASYGEIGNQSGIGLYDYVQNINIGGQYPFGDVQRAQSASLAGMVSNTRTWETLISKNVGLDVGVLSGRLNVSYDYYLKTNKNMLLGVTVPAVLGAAPPKSNNGELDSWGWELSTAWNDEVNEFKYGVRLVLSNGKNKITNLGGFDNYGVGFNGYREGYRSNLYYGYDFAGIIQDEETLNEYKQLGGVPSNIGIGDAMYTDLDGNGRIDAYSDERENGDLLVLGTTDPQYNFGVNLNAEWKGFDFSAFFQGVAKRTVFREGIARIPFFWPWYHPPLLYHNNTWAPDRTDAQYPRLSHSDIRWWNYQHSNNNKENGAYVRLKNVQLGYTMKFPNALMNIKAIQKARIYFSGNDLWDYHKMRGGYDPEDNSGGTNYPFPKTISFGLDVTF
ncbi:TonB-dependent receptor [Echinicola sediminis]